MVHAILSFAHLNYFNEQWAKKIIFVCHAHGTPQFMIKFVVPMMMLN